jgi:RNA polymerase sigma-70 factor (ECF subfamily)
VVAAIQVVMTATKLTDSQLIGLMLSGDREAFAELYRRREGDVYRFALHMSGARDLAEDVTQEVFMVLMREGNSYDETRGSVNAFLLGIARNYVLRRLKQERSFVLLGESDEEGSAPGDLSSLSSSSSQLDVLTRNEEIRSMQTAVLSLPAHYREVLVLCELQDMSYAEAAGVLGCAMGTVRSRLHRARTMLIEKLRPAREETTSAERLKSARCFA